MHHTPIDQSIRDLNEAFVWLPKIGLCRGSQTADESCLRRKRRGPQCIGDLLIPLLIRLGISREELGVP